MVSEWLSPFSHSGSLCRAYGLRMLCPDTHTTAPSFKQYLHFFARSLLTVPRGHSLQYTQIRRKGGITVRVREVEILTGLNRKAIRLYEDKGLLAVERSDNDYREYTAEDVSRLRRIAVLRRAGIALSDIQLWQDRVITGKEMLDKRLSELRDAADAAEDQVRLCNRLSDVIGQNHFDEDVDTDSLLNTLPAAEDEEETEPISPSLPLTLGLDIGTTTISAAVLEPVSRRAVAVYTVRNHYALPPLHPWERLQDAERIFSKVKRLLDFLLKRYPKVTAIGLTGQMHGILYLNDEGRALTPLYTWQDGRAGEGFPSACRYIAEKTGYRLSPGYGLATHVSEAMAGHVPSETAMLCTVMDYTAARLCGHARPITHASNAASLGLFDLTKGCFDLTALETLGIPLSLLPTVTHKAEIVGFYNGIPIAVPIGDNQAGFLGAVRDGAHAALANFGTGSQISLLTDSPEAVTCDPDIEVRPFLEGSFMVSGSALCGGRAYAVVERFFSRYAAACGLPDKRQYETMNRLAADGLKNGTILPVRTTFCGTRSDPTLRGSVTGLTEDNFTPEGFIAGTVMGMAEELYGMFGRMPRERVSTLVVSGNAARLNPALPVALERVFGMAVSIPDHREEAAVGAALFAHIAMTNPSSHKEVTS